MADLQAPLVSVVTPVYNGEKYLRECIESVLSQTYGNWEYTLVNNCSTDRTLEIAQEFAKRHPRVRVITNPVFVGIIENHNNACRQVSAASRYCKLVSADDWLYPECLEKLVGMAERHPEVGIVGSYSISDQWISWTGLRSDATVLGGRDVCRRYLLGEIDGFFVPSTVLYRSELVRSRENFFPGTAPSADVLASLVSLESWDFAFVHQILSFQRLHAEATNASQYRLNAFLLNRLEFVAKLGPRHLTQQELAGRLDALLSKYYAYLATQALSFRERAFWSYHRQRLQDIGHPLSGSRLTAAVMAKVMQLALNPQQTLGKIFRRLPGRRSGKIHSPWD